MIVFEANWNLDCIYHTHAKKMCRVLSLQLRKLMDGKTVLGVGNVIVILLLLLQNSGIYDTDFYSFATATNVENMMTVAHLVF